MIDPSRIDNILEMIRVVWKKYPDLRLFQLLINSDETNGTASYLYNIEDDVLFKELKELYLNRQEQQQLRKQTINA